MVCADGEHSIILEIDASRFLLGNYKALTERIRRELAELGMQVQLAAAPSIKAALALAQAQDGMGIFRREHLRAALADVPLHYAGLSAEHLALLQNLGLRKLKQLWALPRADLAARTHHMLLRHLDQMLGLAPDPRVYFQPPERFSMTLHFDYDIEMHSDLLFPVKRLLQDLGVFLKRRDVALQQFYLDLLHTPNANAADDPDLASGRSTLTIGLRAVERDPNVLLSWAKLKLENYYAQQTNPAKAATPVAAQAGAQQKPATSASRTRHASVRGVRLRVEQLLPYQPQQNHCYEPERAWQGATGLSWDQLADTFRTRLGVEALNQLKLHADPRPEYTQRVIAELHQEPSALPVLARPAWLLPRPIPLRDVVVQILAGPERIESGWWDDAEVRRDYYIVRTTHGQRAWVFKPAGSSSELWMLHGWFA
jgi:protein ImuB